MRLAGLKSEEGNTLVSMLIALAVGGIILGAMSSFLLQISEGDKKFTNSSDVLLLKSDILGRVSCKNTYYTGPTSSFAAECGNTLPYDTTSCGTAPYLPAVDQRGNPLFTGWTGAPKSIGNFQVRSCCPSGKLKIEYRIMKGSNPLVDPLNKIIVYDWPPNISYANLKTSDKANLFPIGSPCGKLLTTSASKKRTKVYGDLKITTAACPGYPFMESPALYQQSYEGIATCPKGTRLVGGGSNCDKMGPMVYPRRSVTADSHPVREPGNKKSDWVEKSKSYAASCCGGVPPAGSLKNRVYAICEDL